MNNQEFRNYNGPFRSGFSQGYNYGKTYMMNGSGRFLYNVGNVLGRGVKIISIGAGKFFTAAKVVGRFIGKIVNMSGKDYKVLGATIWNGIKGFMLKLVKKVKKFAKETGAKIHKQYLKFADKITPEVKPYNMFGRNKSNKKMEYQQRERARKVEARASAMEGATVALALSGIKGIINAYDNLPSRAKKEDE